MTRNIEGINCFLFDLGGVIIDIDPQLTIEAFSKLGYQNLGKEISQSHHDGIFKLLERGDVNEDEFVNRVASLSDKKQTSSSIINAWNQMLVRFPKERIKILEELKRKNPVYLLSNTNAIHRRHFIHMVSGYESIEELFTEVYYSYELGCSKPEALCFEKVIEATGLNPETTLFLDDSPANIEAAQKLGFKTELISKLNSMEDVFA
ncbi:HAD family hydrolase [Carboxylicivirga sp. N1Y90]|uniref:HAD family hydrolase n=1 Tax=Carboxylicivirga fragile TaxID=3417571 RepID=UPI003D34032A|nr:HAD family phosphatase [Marinilabiliaceae bacterium N1Y90]